MKYLKFVSRELKSIPVLQICIVFADGWYRNQPPKDQSVDDQGVPGSNPKTELRKMFSSSHENYTYPTVLV
jgi:hypothetical protein